MLHKSHKRPAKKHAKKKHPKKAVQFDVFTYDDPTGTLPEELVMKIDGSGITFLNQEKTELLTWAWASVGEIEVEAPPADGTASEAEQTDLLHVSEHTAGRFCFECDDGAQVADACAAARP